MIEIDSLSHLSFEWSRQCRCLNEMTVRRQKNEIACSFENEKTKFDYENSIKSREKATRFLHQVTTKIGMSERSEEVKIDEEGVASRLILKRGNSVKSLLCELVL